MGLDACGFEGFEGYASCGDIARQTLVVIRFFLIGFVNWRPPADELQSLFESGPARSSSRACSVSPAEARVAATPATGAALDDIADAFGIARETAGKRLKAVFARRILFDHE
ncbi:hypothetical protein [Methylosinus sp. PW1]|uniref:hypothetical protein n=1 Tax=Methylosinus sp. PW1 TaxID=107636 RepID=UPI000569898A|nr:hypothetical protein [Methylosinus sp. PW1]